MIDIIEEFLDFMASNGCSPKRKSDIKADNMRRNFSLHNDKGSKKSGFYKLSISGDFGFAYFGDYRLDTSFSWASKSSKKYSKEEIEEFRKKARLQEEAEKKKLEEQRRLVAKKAQDDIVFLSDAKEHQYLKKKQIEPCGALIKRDFLVLPMSLKGDVWNYQTIDPQGNKLFLRGALKSGTHYLIDGDDETSYICEGFATGASVHMATGARVYVAFDAGNLEKVIDVIDKKGLVIAADNDHETVINDKPHNTGLIKARKCSQKYNIPYVYPKFEGGEGMTDFNDMHVSKGIDEVRAALNGVESVGGGVPSLSHNDANTGAAPHVKNPDWEDQLITNKNGLVANSTTNAYLVCENDPLIAGLYKYNSFSKNIIVSRCPPWDDDTVFSVRPLQDHDYMPLECYLEKQWGLKTGKNKCADLVQRVAMLDENTFNPASEFFSSLVWDGISRLDTWLKNYVSDGKQSDEYLSLIGRKFMCGLAARAMDAGVKFDTMIILEGEQYAGKSYLSRIMATINNEEYFLDDFKDIENKDALMKMQGKLVVEFPEISTMRKAEVNDLKAFVTRQSDEFRPPYGRNVMVAPRQCVFVGTVNPEGPYFRDMTGNRRYWPISCRRRLALDELKNIMPHLHAEAAHRVREGEELYLNESEYDVARKEQEKRVVHDLWEDKVLDLVELRKEITTDEILQGLGITNDKKAPHVSSRVAQIMAKNGWQSTRITVGTKKRRGYINVDKATEHEEEIKW